MCRGTLPYMAPELVSDPERVSEKADVWSLGMVLWEMLTRQVPFTHLTPQQIIAGLMVGNLQPEVCPPSLPKAPQNIVCLLLLCVGHLLYRRLLCTSQGIKAGSLVVQLVNRSVKCQSMKACTVHTDSSRVLFCRMSFCIHVARVQLSATYTYPLPYLLCT